MNMIEYENQCFLNVLMIEFQGLPGNNLGRTNFQGFFEAWNQTVSHPLFS